MVVTHEATFIGKNDCPEMSFSCAAAISLVASSITSPTSQLTPAHNENGDDVTTASSHLFSKATL